MLGLARLLRFVGEASILADAVYFVAGLAASPILQRAAAPRSVQAAAAAATLVLPTGAGVWWLLRRLRRDYSRSEARSMAITFGLSSPLSLFIGVLTAQVPAGYASYLGSPFGLMGAFIGIAMVGTIFSFAPCALALWIARRVESDGQ
jgi:hypothetical protein